jgi:hypothetical protein
MRLTLNRAVKNLGFVDAYLPVDPIAAARLVNDAIAAVIAAQPTRFRGVATFLPSIPRR